MHDTIAPIENISPERLQNLKGVLFDIDGTFTTHGRIPACSLSALWDLKNGGLKVIWLAGVITLPACGPWTGWWEKMGLSISGSMKRSEN
jgi:hypothetical protein